MQIRSLIKNAAAKRIIDLHTIILKSNEPSFTPLGKKRKRWSLI